MMRFSSKAVSEHAEVPPADLGRWETLVEEWVSRRKSKDHPSDPGVAEGHDVYVVSVGEERDPRVREAQLSEIVSLVRSQGDRVVGQEIRHLANPNPRTLLGKGRAQEATARARELGATMLVLDAELSPSQMRNLEDVAGMSVCDREAVILNVFLRHARTRRARIQVELAQLEYLRPRIRGVGIDMDQQAAGMSKARGPGETASELLARQLDGRVKELKKALRGLATSSETQRRQRDDCKRLALVGYTNAGKTSLMNALTDAALSARDVPFETLDTTSRCLTRHGGDVLLSDTVGFIRRLPERLLASFESTLAEVARATLLVVVVDASDYEKERHLETTERLLDEVGANDIPRFYVFNKLDRVDEPRADDAYARLARGAPFMAVSSHDRASISRLKEALLRASREEDEELDVVVPYSGAASKVLPLVYAKCRVIENRATEDGLRLKLRADRRVMMRVKAALEEAR